MDINVTAIIAIRNGSFYFLRLCEYARKNGINLAIIDNDSQDNLQDLITQNKDVVIKSKTLKYEGYFDLTQQLKAKESLTKELDCDWIIHQDVDELLYSNIKGERIADALKRVHELGFNAVNFDEFVFLPLERFKKFHSDNYHKMKWYYFFEPAKSRLMRAFHRSLKTKINSGGHKLEGDINLYPENFCMRHYIFKNREHAKTKYKFRNYSALDLENRFHRNRLPLQNNEIYLPSKKSLHKYNFKDWVLDKSKPKSNHFWEWEDN